MTREVGINFAMNKKLYFFCYLEANILGNKEIWLSGCVLGWELKCKECDNSRMVNKEILDVTFIKFILHFSDN